MLPSCQTNSAAASSVIEEVAEDTQATDCEGLKPPTFTGEEFNALDQDGRDMLLLWDGLWANICE